MVQFLGHGTLVAAQYTSEGVVVGSDSLQAVANSEGVVQRKEVRKLFRLDERTVCALADLSGCIGPDGSWADFGEVVNRGALNVRHKPSGLTFQDKCNLVSYELDRLLQQLPDAIAGYPKKELSTLLFFGYQGRSARFGFCQFAHEEKTILSYLDTVLISGAELWVLGPAEAIQAKIGCEPKRKENAFIFPVSDSTLEEAASSVRALVSASIEAEPEILGPPVQVETISRKRHG